VGNDDGSIYIYKTKVEGNYKNMELMIDLKFHSDRVSGLYFDPRNMNLFSCSYDMTLFSVDLNDNLYSKSLVYNNTSGFTGLKYMKNNNLLITSDKDGIILIFSIENFHYKYYLNFQSTSLYKINTMDIFGNYVIAGGNNGKVSVFNLTLVKNKIIKEIISFDIGLYKIICIYYNPGNDEIIIGDEIGRIIIWDNKIRSFIYSLITNSQVKINHLWIEDNKNLIWFCGDDKIIKKWKIPKKWYKENIYLYMNNMNFNGKMKQNNFLDLEDNDSISSDEDELNGWSNK
jgi:WD40 repeat protein